MPLEKANKGRLGMRQVGNTLGPNCRLHSLLPFLHLLAIPGPQQRLPDSPDVRHPRLNRNWARLDYARFDD